MKKRNRLSNNGDVEVIIQILKSFIEHLNVVNLNDGKSSMLKDFLCLQNMKR